MRLPYRWRCFACDEPNEPSSTSCASCGFPARATGHEIARARAARGIEAFPARLYGPSAEAGGFSLASWSAWRKGFVLSGAALVAVGAYAWIELSSWRGLGIAVLALLFGGVLLLMGCVRSDASTPAP